MSSFMSSAVAGDRRGFAIVAICGFVAAALALAPAGAGAWLLKRVSPLTSTAGAEGTVWRGKLLGVVHNGVLIGDVGYRLSPLALLIGRISFDADSAGGALAGRARVSIGANGLDLQDVDAAFNLGAIRQYTFFGVRYQGVTRFKADRLALSGDGCAADAATLSTSALEALTQRWSGAALPLSGPIKCKDGDLVAVLDGESADGRVSITITLGPDLAYGVRIAAAPRRPDVSRALQLFGFEDKGRELSYEAAGVLKGLNS